MPGSNPACAGIFPGSSHTSDLKIGTPVATLPGTWRYWVSAGTGWPSASILWLGEMENLVCNFYLSVAAGKIVWADPSLRYTSLLLGCKATNQPNQTKATDSLVPQLLAYFCCHVYKPKYLSSQWPHKSKHSSKYAMLPFDQGLSLWVLLTDQWWLLGAFINGAHHSYTQWTHGWLSVM